MRHVLGKLVGVGRVLHMDRLGHTGDLGGGLGDGTAVLAGDQHMDFGIDNRRHGDGVERGFVEFRIVVIG